MGLFFKKKRTPSGVPTPIRKFSSTQSLALPSKDSAEKVITPKAKEFKMAAGVDGGFDQLPDLAPMPPAPTRPARPAPPPMRPSPSSFAPEEEDYDEPSLSVQMHDDDGPVFISIESYKVILGEIKETKNHLNKLSDVSKKLDDSEFSEERNFASLKSSLKSLHDKLLSVDEILFKQ